MDTMIAAYRAPGAYTLGICRAIERRIRRTCAEVTRVPPPRSYVVVPITPAAYAKRVAALAKARAALAAKVARNKQARDSA